MSASPEIKIGMLVRARRAGFWLVTNIDSPSTRPGWDGRWADGRSVYLKQVLDGTLRSRRVPMTDVCHIRYCKPVTADWIEGQRVAAETGYQRLAAVLSTMKVKP
ncbi:MAG: hypothetical protein A2Y38_23460 [Spirochaetes bacterium GWB1_59_5]|nr:MAG: hypothetical protein A2Y38_23460 [Spirochaetes bacterium GWB1_59_5]